MPLAKFVVGERVEMRCPHAQGGRLVNDWLAGVVVRADYRMAAVQFDQLVLSSTGQPIPDQVLWCTHGSPNLRRPADQPTDSAVPEEDHS
ncbi:MAG: hypothetical protein ABI847_03990 [Anaerolineales bacterium]